jgi:tetratricopeptide (TPR) repeat protein
MLGAFGAVLLLGVSAAPSPSLNELIQQGQAYIGHGQIREAISSFQAASTLDPTHSLPHVALGVALVQAGQLEQGELAYMDALVLSNLPHNQPYVQSAWINLGLVRYKIGKGLATSNKPLAQLKYAEAESSFKQAISSAPQVKNADAHQQMGIMQQLQDKHNEGKTTVQCMGRC